MKNMYRILISILSLSVLSIAQGEDEDAWDKGSAVEAAVAKLDLSDAEKEEMKAILKEFREERKELLSKNGIDLSTGEKPSRKQMREAMPELRELRAETDAKIKGVIGEEKFAVYQELRREAGKKAFGKMKEKKKGY